ncbi:hypothetical protein E2C01_046921 [Portunus trituberculatus]|uniref:Uncharacterized protein n=1 Tax=Portunus trituberculatus TaxID=210409 RepID=A0A5B7G670_PORTR|nr:hypothetical protein [Portunus trituberculatus]
MCSQYGAGRECYRGDGVGDAVTRLRDLVGTKPDLGRPECRERPGGVEPFLPLDATERPTTRGLCFPGRAFKG